MTFFPFTLTSVEVSIMKHFVTITMKMLFWCLLEVKQNILNDEIIVSDVKPVNMFVLKLSQIKVIWNDVLF